MPKPTVYEGEQYGNLTVLREAGKDARSRRMYRVRCGCGAEVVVRGDVLRRGVKRSCGCRGERRWPRARGAETSNWRHGYASKPWSPTYSSWVAMRARCRRPAATSYENYGGRGITICARWDRFEDFLADMGERPDGKTLDRIDVDGNYEPGNVRWATRSQQQRNRRSG